MDWHYTYDHGYENPYGVKVEGWTGEEPEPEGTA